MELGTALLNLTICHFKAYGLAGVCVFTMFICCTNYYVSFSFIFYLLIYLIISLYLCIV